MFTSHGPGLPWIWAYGDCKSGDVSGVSLTPGYFFIVCDPSGVPVDASVSLSDTSTKVFVWVGLTYSLNFTFQVKISYALCPRNCSSCYLHSNQRKFTLWKFFQSCFSWRWVSTISIIRCEMFGRAPFQSSWSVFSPRTQLSDLLDKWDVVAMASGQKVVLRCSPAIIQRAFRPKFCFAFSLHHWILSWVTRLPDDQYPFLQKICAGSCLCIRAHRHFLLLSLSFLSNSMQGNEIFYCVCSMWF